MWEVIMLISEHESDTEKKCVRLETGDNKWVSPL